MGTWSAPAILSSNTTEMFPSPASSCARWRSETSACCDTCLRVRPRRFLDSRTRRPRERRKSPFSDVPVGGKVGPLDGVVVGGAIMQKHCTARSEEHTSELQSRLHLVCRLL